MIILTCKDQVKIHTIEGDFVFEFNHYIEKPGILSWNYK